MTSLRCPIHKRACATAYRLRKCRCSACRGWNAARERRRVQNITLQELDAKVEEFVQAIRLDPHYVIDFASAFWRVRR